MVWRTYDFLTCLRAEFEPLCAQLLTREPYVSLMDALAAVRNETRLHTAGLLQSSSVLAVRSASSKPTAPLPMTPSSVAPSSRSGGGWRSSLQILR
uniref:Uncharacterized protein n=1 Tax=Arundo donax TaxID=35708 RepID=A0A0A9ADD6_ARUDO